MLEPESDQRISRSLERFDFKPVHTEAFDPLSEDELAVIEGLVQAELPADYRWFLRTYGACTAGAGTTQFTTSKGDRYELRNFHGKPSSVGLSLKMGIEDFYGLLDKNELPIADDLMGSQIALNARTNKVGFISRDGPRRVHSITDSFSSLIVGLEPYVLTS